MSSSRKVFRPSPHKRSLRKGQAQISNRGTTRPWNMRCLLPTRPIPDTHSTLHVMPARAGIHATANNARTVLLPRYAEALWGLTPLKDLPHLDVRSLDVAGKSCGVEQRARVPVLLQSFPVAFQESGIGGQPHRQGFVVRDAVRDEFGQADCMKQARCYPAGECPPPCKSRAAARPREHRSRSCEHCREGCPGTGPPVDAGRGAGGAAATPQIRVGRRRRPARVQPREGCAPRRHCPETAIARCRGWQREGASRHRKFPV